MYIDDPLGEQLRHDNAFESRLYGLWAPIDKQQAFVRRVCVHEDGRSKRLETKTRAGSLPLRIAVANAIFADDGANRRKWRGENRSCHEKSVSDGPQRKNS